VQNGEPPETIADVMERDVVTVSADDDIDSLLKVMRRHELPGVPVVDAAGHLVGIVTESDLVIRDEQGDLHLPHHVDLLGAVIFLEPIKHFEERLRHAIASTVADLMTPDPLTVSPEDSVRDAARLISEHGHNRLPVVDGDGRLVGVVTRVDVLSALAREERGPRRGGRWRASTWRRSSATSGDCARCSRHRPRCAQS
jgi:CBS domain-containing protein